VCPKQYEILKTISRYCPYKECGPATLIMLYLYFMLRVSFLFLNGQVGGHPEQQIVANPVVDDLIEPLVRNHQAYGVQLHIHQQVVAQERRPQGSHNIRALFPALWEP
jgi:hypothetical protein